jgi:hypothetical protein
MLGQGRHELEGALDSTSVCVSVCMCLWACVCTCGRVSVQACVMPVCVYAGMYVCAPVCLLCTVCMCLYGHVYVSVWARLWVCTCVCVCVHKLCACLHMHEGICWNLKVGLCSPISSLPELTQSQVGRPS